MGSADSKERTDGHTSSRIRRGIGHTERISRNNGSLNRKNGHRQGKNNLQAQLDENGFLTAEEVSNRQFGSEKVMKTAIGNDASTNVTYAYLTQRGYYPDDLHKANQDALSITKSISGLEGNVLFAVYDGHGPYGHKCSNFAKEQLPRSISKYIQQERAQLHKELQSSSSDNTHALFNPRSWPMLTEDILQRSCSNAHHECNDLMKEKEPLSTLSGTTSISILFHNNLLTVCNVGDSRVVLGYKDDATSRKSSKPTEKILNDSVATKLVAIPLSRDQTGWREDERERVKKCGGRIMTIDQIEGRETVHEDFGDFDLGDFIDVARDPPRVWLKDEDKPGCAFTRSLGDSIGEKVGVIADPEVFTKELTVEDKVLIIASDGVFEFLTNEKIIELCEKSDDPFEACKKIVNESCNEWLKHEDRTDDITVIVLFLNHSPENSQTSESKENIFNFANVKKKAPRTKRI